MLVFTRKKSESFEIGDNIKITIIKITGDKVRVGINAPDGVPVKRCELNGNGRNVANQAKRM